MSSYIENNTILSNSIIYNNTYLRLLSYDLINYIENLLREWANKILLKNIIKFKIKIIKNDVNNLKNILQFAQRYNYNMRNYKIQYKDKLLGREDVFNIFISCKCCKRHQMNRPKTFTRWIEREFNNTQNVHSCMCSCRNLSRWLCREID